MVLGPIRRPQLNPLLSRTRLEEKMGIPDCEVHRRRKMKRKDRLRYQTAKTYPVVLMKTSRILCSGTRRASYATCPKSYVLCARVFRYAFLRQLGAGAFGAVFLAFDKKNQSEVL